MAMLGSGDLHWDSLEAEDIAAKLDALQASGRPAITGYLDAHQWVPLAHFPSVHIDGGYASAQFRQVALTADLLKHRFWRLESSHITAQARTPHQLRRYLGSLGIQAWQIGDIAIGDYIALVADPMIDLTKFDLSAVERDAWRPPECQVTRATSASARADAVIASLFHVSREEAQTAIKYGFVFRNFAALAKRTQELQPGDCLIYRTKGKAEVLALELNPRSKRMWVDYRMYPA